MMRASHCPHAAASGDADGALPLLQSSGRRLELLVAELGAVAGALEPRSTGLAELQVRLCWAEL